MWLPLALSDIASALFGLLRVWGAKIDVPEAAELLKGWGLPIMAEAMETDDKERKALALLRSVQRLAEQQRRRARHGEC